MNALSAKGSVVKIADMLRCRAGPFGCDVTNLYLPSDPSPDIQKVTGSIDGGLVGEGVAVSGGISVGGWVGVGGLSTRVFVGAVVGIAVICVGRGLGVC